VINLQRVFLSHTDRDRFPQNLNMQKEYRSHKEAKSISKPVDFPKIFVS
jgi:hypothetical protein